MRSVLTCLQERPPLNSFCTCLQERPPLNSFCAAKRSSLQKTALSIDASERVPPPCSLVKKTGHLTLFLTFAGGLCRAVAQQGGKRGDGRADHGHGALARGDAALEGDEEEEEALHGGGGGGGGEEDGAEEEEDGVEEEEEEERKKLGMGSG